MAVGAMLMQRRALLKLSLGLAGFATFPAVPVLALAPPEGELATRARDQTANVRDFGAKGDGANDDTSAIQKALDSAAMVFFPPGRYRVSALSLNSPGKYLYGSYKKSQLLSTGNENLLDIKGSDIRIRDLMFTNESVARSGGAFIAASGNFVNIDHCHFERGHLGVVSTSTLFSISDCDFRNFSAGKGICIQINGGFAVTLDKIRSDHSPAARPLAGINITSTGDTTISNCAIMNCGTDLLVNPTSGKVVASVYASNTFFDTASRGIALVPGDRGAIVRTHFMNCWTSSHNGVGTVVDSGSGLIDGVSFINHQSNLNGGDGVLLTGQRSLNIHFLGGEMAGNGGGGITVGARSSRFYLHNVFAGAVHGIKGNAYGIKIGPGCTEYQVTNCTCQNNQVAQITDESLAGRLHDNVGLTTRTSGRAFIPGGASSAIVKHGLAAPPTSTEISITPTSKLIGNSLFLDIESVTLDSFTVRSASNANEALHFAWQARCLGA